MTKKCCKCKEDKDVSEFNKNKTKKDGLSTYCRICNGIRSKQYYREKKEEHLVNVTRRKKITVKINKDIMTRYKEDGCKVCGEKEICCLDFHHIDSSEKEYTIARMIYHSIKTITKEIEKCIVLCSNCHRKVHAGLIEI